MNVDLDNFYGGNRISTALLLVAGTGSRLFPLTKSSPKCLDKGLSLESVSFDHQPWYEINTIHDLSEAEKLFPLELKKQEVFETESV